MAEPEKKNVIEKNTSKTSNQSSLRASLRALWFPRRPSSNGKLDIELKAVFSKYTRPLEEFLDLLEVSLDPGWNGTFSFYITKYFFTWLNDTNDPDAVKLNKDLRLDKSVQLRAFVISSRAPSRDIKRLIFQHFKLSQHREFLVSSVARLKESFSFSQLSHWVCLYGMEDMFDSTEYLHPMLLRANCCNDVLQHLEEHPELVKEIVQHADAIFLSNAQLLKQFKKHSMPQPHEHVLSLTSRNIEHFIKQCYKKFNIPKDITPNFNWKLIENEIRFYVGALNMNEMSEDGLKERVTPLCQNDVKVQKFLVQALMRKKQTQYLSEYFCNLFNISMNHPQEVPRVEWEEDYHAVDGLLNMTVFVDSETLFKDLLEYIDNLPGEDIPVGLDSEWKSTCTHITRTPSIFQIAFEKRVFLVDMLKLHRMTQLWEKLNDKLFTNSKFIKLGYGIENDSYQLAIYKNLSFINLGGTGFIDLLAEERKYKKEIPVKFPHEDEEVSNHAKGPKGLARLVRLCFAKPLDKREQLSDWENRPLRSPQLQYAAMDAYCLLEAYGVIKDMHKEANLRFSFRNSVKKQRTKSREQHLENGNRRRQFKKRYWHPRRKVEASVQASIDSSEVSTQTSEE